MSRGAPNDRAKHAPTTSCTDSLKRAGRTSSGWPTSPTHWVMGSDAPAGVAAGAVPALGLEQLEDGDFNLCGRFDEELENQLSADHIAHNPGVADEG